jgi:hypothetical protein
MSQGNIAMSANSEDMLAIQRMVLANGADLKRMIREMKSFKDRLLARYPCLVRKGATWHPDVQNLVENAKNRFAIFMEKLAGTGTFFESPSCRISSSPLLIGRIYQLCSWHCTVYSAFGCGLALESQHHEDPAA